MGALTLTYKKQYKDQYAPLLPGVEHFDFNDVAAMDALNDPALAAIILEPIQGEGGVNPATWAFMKYTHANHTFRSNVICSYCMYTLAPVLMTIMCGRCVWRGV